MPDLGKAYVQIVPSAEGVSSGISDIVLPEADSAGENAGRSMGDKLATALKATLIAAGIGAIIKQAVGSVNELADYGDNIDKMSQKMGMSAEAYQEWDAVMQHSGTSMETMKASMKTLANAAETGNAAFEELGITQEELQSLNQEQLFERTISALQDVEDDTQRTYLAGKTLGRGATELGALLNTSAEDTQKMRDRVHELGGVMSDEAVKDAAAYKDSLQDMQTAISGFGRGIVQEFLPSFTQVMDGIAEIFSGDAGTGVGMVLDGVKGIGEKIAQAVPQVLQAGGEIVKGIIQGIAERLPDMLTSAGEMILTFIQGVWEKVPEVLTAAAETVSQFLAGLTERMPDILNSGGDAVSNFISGLIQNFPQIITAIASKIPDIISAVFTIITAVVQFLANNFPLFVQKGIEIIQNLAQGLIDNWPAISAAIVDLLARLLQAILDYLPDLLDAGIQLIKSLADGILQIMSAATGAAGDVAQAALDKIKGFASDMLDAGKEWIQKVIDGIASMINDLTSKAKSTAQSALDNFTADWSSIGSNIISGIISGISGAAEGLYNKMKSIATNALNAAKDLLGIESPSKVFRDQVGKMIPEGIAVGIDMNADAVDEAVADLANPLAFDTSAYMPSEVASPYVNGGHPMGNWTINVYPSEGMDEKKLADYVADSINRQIRRKGAAFA